MTSLKYRIRDDGRAGWRWEVFTDEGRTVASGARKPATSQPGLLPCLKASARCRRAMTHPLWRLSSAHNQAPVATGVHRQRHNPYTAATTVIAATTTVM
jgi:hypothetical protein